MKAKNPEAVLVGQRIIAARERKGMIQAELVRRLAERMPYTDEDAILRRLINAEKGHHMPRASFLRAIGDVTDEPLDYFFRDGAEDGAAAAEAV